VRQGHEGGPDGFLAGRGFVRPQKGEESLQDLHLALVWVPAGEQGGEGEGQRSEAGVHSRVTPRPVRRGTKDRVALLIESPVSGIKEHQ